jgi:hypothetical protein
MKKIFLIYLFIAFTFVTCTNDGDDSEPATPTEVLTISSTPDSAPVTFWDEVWFVAWDDDGTLLDYKKFIKGQATTLSTTEKITNNKVTLGYFRKKNAVDIPGSKSQTNVQIFTDLEVGRTLEFEAPEGPGSSQGSFSLNVKNLPEAFIYMSSKYGGDNEDGNLIHDDDTYVVEMPNGVKKFIVNFDNIPNSYALLDNVTSGSTVTIGPDDFKPYENEVTFNLPSDYTNLGTSLMGFESDQPLSQTAGYILDGGFYEDGPSTHTTGYFSGITKFQTNLFMNYGGAQVGYVKAGSLPGTINWPNPNKYSVDSTDPNAFSASVTEQVEYMVDAWNFSDEGNITNVTINSPKLAPKIGAVPAEMITANPAYTITKDRFINWSAGFVVKGSESYEAFVTRYFSGKVVEYEQMLVVLKGQL